MVWCLLIYLQALAPQPAPPIRSLTTNIVVQGARTDAEVIAILEKSPDRRDPTHYQGYVGMGTPLPLNVSHNLGYTSALKGYVEIPQGVILDTQITDPHQTLVPCRLFTPLSLQKWRQEAQSLHISFSSYLVCLIRQHYSLLLLTFMDNLESYRQKRPITPPSNAKILQLIAEKSGLSPSSVQVRTQEETVYITYMIQTLQTDTKTRLDTLFHCSQASTSISPTDVTSSLSHQNSPQPEPETTAEKNHRLFSTTSTHTTAKNTPPRPMPGRSSQGGLPVPNPSPDPFHAEEDEQSEVERRARNPSRLRIRAERAFQEHTLQVHRVTVTPLAFNPPTFIQQVTQWQVPQDYSQRLHKTHTFKDARSLYYDLKNYIQDQFEADIKQLPETDQQVCKTHMENTLSHWYNHVLAPHCFNLAEQKADQLQSAQEPLKDHERAMKRQFDEGVWQYRGLPIHITQDTEHEVFHNIGSFIRLLEHFWDEFEYLSHQMSVKGSTKEIHFEEEATLWETFYGALVTTKRMIRGQIVENDHGSYGYKDQGEGMASGDWLEDKIRQLTLRKKRFKEVKFKSLAPQCHQHALYQKPVFKPLFDRFIEKSWENYRNTWVPHFEREREEIKQSIEAQKTLHQQIRQGLTIEGKKIKGVALAVLELQEIGSEEEIKQAYRKRALFCHPDKNNTSEAAETAQKFQSLTWAYNVALELAKGVKPRGQGEFTQRKTKEACHLFNLPDPFLVP